MPQRLRELLSLQCLVLALGKELVCVAPSASLLAPVPSLRINKADPPDAGARHFLEYPPIGLPCPRTVLPAVSLCRGNSESVSFHRAFLPSVVARPSWPIPRVWP